MFKCCHSYLSEAFLNNKLSDLFEFALNIFFLYYEIYTKHTDILEVTK